MKFFNTESDFSNITCSKAVKGPDGKYFIETSNGGNDIVCMVGPDARSVSQLTPDITTMEVELSSGTFTDFIQECDDFILGLTKDNKGTWFPAQGITDKWLEDAFMNSTKLHKKTQKSTFKMKTTKSLENSIVETPLKYL